MPQWITLRKCMSVEVVVRQKTKGSKTFTIKLEYYTSLLNGDHRKNNRVEDWHTKFQKLMVHHPLICIFIEVRKRKTANCVNKVSPRFLVITLQYGHQIHNNTDKNQIAITAIVNRYNEYKSSN